jgi:prephenate dehydratase
MRIAYPGAGSYSEEAATLLFPDATALSMGGWEEVISAAWEGRADRAVLPIENSLAGFVPDTLTALEAGRLSIVAEVTLHIPHCLLGIPGSRIEQIRIVHSHPMALAQCRGVLDAGGWQRIGAATTADAARTVESLGDPTVAAIASPLAARQHGLVVLEDEVSDHPENLTRFVALAPFTRIDRDDAQTWCTAMRFITRHEPGALHAAIEPFRYHDVQMTSLHSRPILGEAWRYQFYVDIEGHRNDAKVLRALRDVAERTAFLETLGTYPVSRQP